MAEENLSATLTIAAPVERVFAVLADPATHAAIDGTGWVREAVDLAPLTELGQVFRMGMYHTGHPTRNYRTANKIELFEAPRTIGWLTGGEKDDGTLDLGGWLWRYDLAPIEPAGTEVTLTYDWSAVPQFRREVMTFPPFGPDHLVNSLHHLAEIAAPTPAD